MAARTSHAGWKVVIGSGIGISFGSLVFMGAGFALLASAWAQQFGWTQPDLAKAATIFLLIQTTMYPVCGWMLDRWGSRKVATGSIALFAISLILLSQIGDSLTQMYLAFGLVSLVSAGTNVVSYARAIALWFDRRRGLALGLAASAQAVGSFLIPILAQKIIAQSGWSAALLSLAAVELLVCLPLVALLVKDRPPPDSLLHDDAQSAETASGAKHEAAGMDVRNIVRTATFWKLAVCFAIMGLSLYAIAANIAFILTETAGMTLADVAMIQAVSGLSVLFGRIGFGYLLDKLQAPIVGLLTIMLAAACFGLYATATTPALILVAAALGGIAVGGETDLMPYLASRYFGTRAVSKTFGWFLSAFFIGAAIGPIAFAQLSAAYGGVVTPLFILAALQLVPAIMFLSLGHYPEADFISEKSTPPAT